MKHVKNRPKPVSSWSCIHVATLHQAIIECPYHEIVLDQRNEQGEEWGRDILWYPCECYTFCFIWTYYSQIKIFPSKWYLNNALQCLSKWFAMKYEIWTHVKGSRNCPSNNCTTKADIPYSTCMLRRVIGQFPLNVASPV